MDKIALIVATLALIGVGLFLINGGETSQAIGGITNYDSLSVTDGYYINDVLVFNSSKATFGIFTEGGGVLSIATSSSAYTLTEAQLLSSNVIDFNATGANVTLTLPATSTMTTFIPDAGDTRRFVIRAAYTTATTTTIAAGTGIDLQEPDGQNVVIAGTNYAWLTCYRLANTDVSCLVDESIPAD